MERGLGDDQSPRGMWGDLDPWLASLWAGLLQIKPLPEGTVVDDTPRLEPPVFSMTPAEASDSSSAGTVLSAPCVLCVPGSSLSCFFLLWEWDDDYVQQGFEGMTSRTGVEERILPAMVLDNVRKDSCPHTW